MDKPILRVAYMKTQELCCRVLGWTYSSVSSAKSHAPAAAEVGTCNFNWSNTAVMSASFGGIGKHDIIAIWAMVKVCIPHEAFHVRDAQDVSIAE